MVCCSQGPEAPNAYDGAGRRCRTAGGASLPDFSAALAPRVTVSALDFFSSLSTPAVEPAAENTQPLQYEPRERVPLKKRTGRSSPGTSGLPALGGTAVAGGGATVGNAGDGGVRGTGDTTVSPSTVQGMVISPSWTVVGATGGAEGVDGALVVDAVAAQDAVSASFARLLAKPLRRRSRWGLGAGRQAVRLER